MYTTKSYSKIKRRPRLREDGAVVFIHTPVTFMSSTPHNPHHNCHCLNKIFVFKPFLSVFALEKVGGVKKNVYLCALI